MCSRVDDGCVFGGSQGVVVGDRRVVHGGDRDRYRSGIGEQRAVGGAVSEVRRAVEIGVGGERHRAVTVEHHGAAAAAGDTGDCQRGAIHVAIIAQQLCSRVDDGCVFGGSQCIVVGDRRVIHASDCDGCRRAGRERTTAAGVALIVHRDAKQRVAAGRIRRVDVAYVT